MEISRQLLAAQLKTGLMPILPAVLLLYGFGMPSLLAQEYSPYSKMDDPNIKHFYMGRQEIEVFDNTPIVKYRGGAGGAQSSAAPGGPVPLPAAGFQQYSSNVHGGPLNLPKVENGVPRKAPPPPPLKGNAARLKGGARSSIKNTASSSAAPVIKTYKQTYQSRPQSQPAAAPSAAAGYGSTQKVHGKLLPWANTRHKSNY